MLSSNGGFGARGGVFVGVDGCRVGVGGGVLSLRARTVGSCSIFVMDDWKIGYIVLLE